MFKVLKLLLVGCCLCLAACGSRTPHSPQTNVPPDTRIADERIFPQDVHYYARQAGNRVLLNSQEQAAFKTHFDQTFFGPWHITHGSVSRKDACIRKARGYRLGGARWTQEEWDAVVRNAALDTFPSRAQYAITIRNTDIREIPTHEPRYDRPVTDPVSYPFDDFQYTLLAIGTPVFISHVSADGHWYFIESPLVGGWIDADDVALTDQDFMERWESMRLCAILKDRIPLPFAGTPANIGTVIPMISAGASKIRVYFPVRNAQGYAAMHEVSLQRSEAAPHPVPMHVQTVADIAAQLVGQHYGWGGMYGLRDCSATTHDILAPFGIWLPRNSRAQARTGLVIPLNDMSAAEKDATIRRLGTPFLSLVGLPGHITLYIGTHDNRAAILHNVWGVRTVDGENTNARHIIGKTVITSIQPGMELPDLYRTRTFVDRIRSLTTPRR